MISGGFHKVHEQTYLTGHLSPLCTTEHSCKGEDTQTNLLASSLATAHCSQAPPTGSQPKLHQKISANLPLWETRSNNSTTKTLSRAFALWKLPEMKPTDNIQFIPQLKVYKPSQIRKNQHKNSGNSKSQNVPLPPKELSSSPNNAFLTSLNCLKWQTWNSESGWQKSHCDQRESWNSI